MQNEWVICRIFQKSAAGKKLPFPGLICSDSYGTEFNPSSNLPPLMESSPYNTNYGLPHHVSCFSNSMETPQTSHYHHNTDQPSLNGLLINNNPYNTIPSNLGDNYYNRFGGGNPFIPSQTGHNYSDQHILKAILDNQQGAEMKQGMKTEVINYSASQETGLSSDMNAEISSVVSNYDMGRRPFDDSDGPSTSGGLVDLDSLWNY